MDEWLAVLDVFDWKLDMTALPASLSFRVEGRHTEQLTRMLCDQRTEA